MSCGVVTQFMQENGIRLTEEVLQDVSIDFSGAGIGVKQVELKQGQQVIQHRHKFPHLSVLLKGRVKIITDLKTIEIEAPASMVIEAEINHYLIALEDSLWLCIHRTESMDLESLCSI